MLYVLTQLERELPSNQYGTRTTQHMYDLTSVELSNSSLRYTQNLSGQRDKNVCFLSHSP